jgi:cyclic pyranopterin phosphate synthase
VAEASCRFVCEPTTLARLEALPKGDAFAAARIAGIQAAKRTDEWIPLAHTLPLEEVAIEFERAGDQLAIRSRVVATARTGAEMEALVACSAAALTIYDMVKGLDRSAEITELHLDAKSGGRRGDYRRSGEAER